MTSRPQTSSHLGPLSQSSSWNQIPQSSCETGLGRAAQRAIRNRNRAPLSRHAGVRGHDFLHAGVIQRWETNRVLSTCHRGLDGSPEGNPIHSEAWEETCSKGATNINSSISNIDICDWASPRMSDRIWWMLLLFAACKPCCKQTLQADLSHKQQHFSVQTFPFTEQNIQELRGARRLPPKCTVGMQGMNNAERIDW